MRLMGKTKEQVNIERLEILAKQIRMERDRRIMAVQWRRDRYNDEVTLGMTPTEPIEPILQYIQALRDVPQQEGFPENVQWPEEP